MEKNIQSRRLKNALVASLLVLALLLMLIPLSIPLVNNGWAAQVKNRLIETPLPENAQCIDSLSCAGKLTGNGNGMQYLGAILIRSELTYEKDAVP